MSGSDFLTYSGEPEKIAIHYGIIYNGGMIKEMTAKRLEAGCRTYVVCGDFGG